MACPACGTAHELDQRFCGACGAPLADAAVDLAVPVADDDDPVVGARSWIALVGAVVGIVAVMAGLVTVLSLGPSDDEGERALVEYDDAAAPTAAVVTEVGSASQNPFAVLGLDRFELALRTDRSVRLVDPATGLSRTVEVDRLSGGEAWFAGRRIVLRAQSSTGPSVAILDLDTARYRLYGSLDFIPSAAAGDLVLGRELGDSLGGGRWITLEIESLELGRLELAADAAFSFPVVIDSGVVVEQGSRVVRFDQHGQPLVLGTGQITATGTDVVLLTDCDEVLVCTATSVAGDGTALASGPAIQLPELFLGGVTRLVSPDGRYLAHLAPATRELFVVDIASGEAVPHGLGRTAAGSMVWTASGERLLLADGDELRVVEVPTGASTVIELEGRVDQVALVPIPVSE